MCGYFGSRTFYLLYKKYPPGLNGERENTMKKILSIVIVIAMLISTITLVSCTTVAKDVNGSEGLEYMGIGFTFVVDGIGVCKDVDIKIPSLVYELSVVGISQEAFAGSKTIRSVKIPNSVTYISDYAFSNCTSLESVSLSNSLRTIYPYAFKNCVSLKTIVIPPSVQTIGKYAFASCLELETIDLGDYDGEISELMLYNCRKLSTIIYQGTVKEWEDLKKHSTWDADTGNYIVKCLDGTVSKDGIITYN